MALSQEAEKIKKLVNFKKKVERKIEELQTEISEQQLMLETVNSILIEKGFKRAEITRTPVPAEISPLEKESTLGPTSETSEKIVPLETATGEVLATLHISPNLLRIVLAQDKKFTLDIPPFTQFLVERVLTKMKEKDSELLRTGKLKSDKIFSYDVVQKDNVIHELVIKNFDSKRLRELKSSVRWTLEKMYEKMRNQN